MSSRQRSLPLRRCATVVPFRFAMPVGMTFVALSMYHNYRLLRALASKTESSEAAPAPPRTSRFEAHVVSHRAKAVTKTFRRRNLGSGLFDGRDAVTWFPAVNGSDPDVLQRWWQTAGAGLPAGWQKRQYSSPHVVGCYESHRRLLAGLSKRWNEGESVPDAAFVFEDDAECVDGTAEDVMGVVSTLPSDWDVLFVGGKPFSYMRGTSKNKNDIPAEDYDRLVASDNRVKGEAFRKVACDGSLGVRATGPFFFFGNGDGDNEDENIPRYWRTDYVLNTHAYVVNPRRIHKLLKVLEDGRKVGGEKFRPVDMTLAAAMKSLDNATKINAYLTARGAYCRQHDEQKYYRKRTSFDPRAGPPPWEGYYWHESFGYVWEDMYFEECEESYRNGSF